MAPTRHGTTGAGPPDPDDNPPTYGTRSSKRKAADITEDEQLNGQESKKTSPVATKKQKTVELKTSPLPKKRSGRQRSQPAKVSASTTPEEENPSSNSASPQPLPEIALDGPTGTSEDEPSQNSSPKKGGWTEPPSMETLLPPSIPTLPFKNSFRGRGSSRGGRNGRGGRGGRPPKHASSGRATPAPSNGIVKVGRGGGRGRARKQTSAELKALSKRKDDLKQLYRVIAQQQKLALSVIAEKSLAKVTEEPEYHKTLPEYETVTTRLDAIRDDILLQLDMRAQLEMDAAKRLYDGQVVCENKIFDNHIDSIYEKFDTRIVDQSTYIHLQRRTKAAMDEIPFSKGEYGRIVQHVEMPAKIVHPFGTAKFKAPVPVNDFGSVKGNPHYKQDPKFYKTVGDNDFEQHPANHYLTLTEEGRRAFRESEKREVDSMKKEKGRKKVTNKDPLFSNTVKVLEEEPGNEEDQALEEVKDVVAKPSQYDSEDYHDPAPEQPEDEHGCSVPRKRGRGKAAAPNNRIITPAFIPFGEDDDGNGDIGIRQHVFKNINGDVVDVGRDVNPNPKNFYVNQVVSGHNSAKNKPGDLDENLVKKYKVHPIFGVGITGSVNPDEDDPENPTFGPKTRRTGGFPESHCKTFIHEDRSGERSITYTSQSMAALQAYIDSNYALSQMRMFDILEKSGDLKDYLPPRKPEGAIDPALIKAAREALALEYRKQAAPTPKPVAIPATKIATPQRTGHYDPVRDSQRATPYQTPYLQLGQQPIHTSYPTQPPIVHPPGYLGDLAQAAEIKTAADTARASGMAAYTDMRSDPLPPPPSMTQSYGNPFSHPSGMHIQQGSMQAQMQSPIQGSMQGQMQSPIQGSMQSPMQLPMQSSMQSPMQGYMGPPPPLQPSSMMYPHGQQLQQYQTPFSYHTHPPPPPPPPQYQQQAQPHPQHQQQMQQQSPRMGHAPAGGGGLRELRPAAAKSRNLQQPQPPQAPGPPGPPGWNPYGTPPTGQR